MILPRDRVIGGLELLRVPFMNDMEVQDILDSAIQMLKDDAPVEPEEYEVRDSDTGELMGVERFCGYCTRLLSDKPFCPHCGKKVLLNG